MGRMICDDVYLFYDDELPAERARQFALHLPDCPSCSREMRELAKFDTEAADVLLGESVPPPPISGWKLVVLLIAVYLISLVVLTVVFAERT